MTAAIAIVIAGLCFAYVAWPLIYPAATDDPGAPVAPDTRKAELERAKADAYSAIREAETDFHMGKLSPADLELQKRKYEAIAIEAIAELGRLATPAEKTAAPTGKIKFCPRCGSSVPPKSKFCPACGTGLGR